ncbi:MAG: hypothetical protein COC19_06860 [SAR86 cluster bacterium]|uniref:HXXEE domain-containing protein n=1 Tax=SAR86 cluster bacterium TaxID=2030880 RepID=A0A2A4MHM5_9GAMM|nr:MAG: hypothetical protein COC19_06860 [SAR86 cluster bacterium]
MKDYWLFFYQHWPKVGIGWGVMGLVLIGVLYPLGLISHTTAIAFAITCAYPLHQFEEYVYPGGFMKDLTRNFLGIKDLDAIMDTRAIFLVNIPLIWLVLPTMSVWTFFNPDVLSALALFSLIAGLAHVVSSIKGRRLYNPGLFISCLLNIPLGIIGLILFENIHPMFWSMALFWLLFVGWGIYLGARYKATKDPHYDRQAWELGVIYIVVLLHYALLSNLS